MKYLKLFNVLIVGVILGLALAMTLNTVVDTSTPATSTMEAPIQTDAELVPLLSPDVDSVTSRYHLRKRTARFFRRVRVT